MRIRTIALGGLMAAALSSPTIAATTYAYDALGRLTTVTYDDGSHIIYSYDAAGNRTQTQTTSTGGGAATKIVLFMLGAIVIVIPVP